MNLRVYLVTSSDLVPKGKNLLQIIKEAVSNGVTIVQLREKAISTRDFVALAQETIKITSQFGVKLLINDRIDVALAVEADGVHLGQTDMPIKIARQILGPDKIIGITVENSEQALSATKDGADYLGIGACYNTCTKKLEKIPMGPFGVRQILESLPIGTKAVTIGGIKSTNALNVLQKSIGKNGEKLSGIAVVSDIICASDVPQRVKDLVEIVEKGLSSQPIRANDHKSIGAKIIKSLELMRVEAPFVHQISYFMDEISNTTLALGASPIISQYANEAQSIHSLLLNIDSINKEFIDGMVIAGQLANTNGTPIILGLSATNISTTRDLVEKVKVDVINGSIADISALVGSHIVTRIGSTGGLPADKALELVKLAAFQQRCVVAMTGTMDYVSDGYRTVGVNNGHELLSKINGLGSMATAAIAAYSTKSSDDCFSATVGGLVSLGIAAELASKRIDVKGPSSFKIALLDELYHLNREKISAMINIKVFS